MADTRRRVIALARCVAASVATAAVTGPDGDWSYLQRQWLTRLGRALGLQASVIGTPVANALWVANHVSWLDIPLLGGLAPLRFVAKREVRDWPLVGRLAARTGTRFTARCGILGLRALIDDLAARLAAGENVIVFPEGTTTDGTRLAPFRAALLQAAVAAGRPVQPVALRYVEADPLRPVAPFVGNASLAGHLGRFLRGAPPTAEVTFLPPLPTACAAVHRLASESRAAIARRLAIPERDTLDLRLPVGTVRPTADVIAMSTMPRCPPT